MWGAGLCWYVKAKWICIQLYLAHISFTEPQRVYSVVQMIVKWTIFWCVHEYSFMVWLMKYLNVVRIKVQFLKRLSPLSCFHRDCRDRWKQHKLSGFATWLVALQVFCHNLQHSILIKDRRPSVTLTALYRKIQTNNGKDLKDKICLWSSVVT